MMQRIDVIVRNPSTFVRKPRFFVQIIDVRILKSDLPTENSDAIYQRMQKEIIAILG